MTWYTDGPIGTDAPLEELPATLRASVGAAVDDAFISNPTTVIYDYSRYSRANNGPKLDKADAEGRAKAAGVSLKIPDAGYSEDALGMLIERKQDEIRRQSILARAPSGVIPSTTRFAASMLTSVLDPLNVASAFVPIVGQARYAEMLAGAGGAVGRLGVRAGVGAAEGLVGAALVEPINYFGRTQMQDDYHMSDSLMNLAFGAGLGAGLHGAAGAVGDRLGVSGFARAEQRRIADATAEARMRAEGALPDENISIPGLLEKQRQAIEEIHAQIDLPRRVEPGSAEARVDAMSQEGRQASIRVAVAQAMEGRIPDVEGIARTDAQAHLNTTLDQVPLTNAEDGLVNLHREAGKPDAAPPNAATVSAIEAAAPQGQRDPFTRGTDIARTLAESVKAAYPEARRAEGFASEAARLRQSAEKMQATPDVAAAYSHAADVLEGWARVSANLTPAAAADPVTAARAVAERQAAPESIAVADFQAARAADERLAAQPAPESAAQDALTLQTEKLESLLKSLEARGMRPERIEAMRAELKPFDEQLADSKKLGNAMKAAAVCGIK